MTRTPENLSRGALLSAVAVAVVLLLTSCAPSLRQQIMNASADVLVQNQADREAFYQAQHLVCIERGSFDEYRECMGPARAIATAADAFEGALRVAQEAQDAGNADSFAAALPGLISTATEFVRALERSRLDVPPEVRAISDLLIGGE